MKAQSSFIKGQNTTGFGLKMRCTKLTKLIKRRWLLLTILTFIFFTGNILLVSNVTRGLQNFVLNFPFSNVQIIKIEPTKQHIKSPKARVKKLNPTKTVPGDKDKPESQRVINEVPDSRPILLTPGKVLPVKMIKQETLKPELIMKPVNEFKYKLAVLVIACNRPSVGRCLDRLLKYKPEGVNIPVIVSQDCGHEQTARVIKSYKNKVKHIQQPDLGDVPDVPPHMAHFMGYYKISRHYKWALSQVFQDKSIDSVIIVEDDLDIAPDFFEYFMATRPLLDLDKSLWCVSAWNDNGKKGFVDGNDLLYRNDFFSGLGWMIRRAVWNELANKWPKGFWDDWMRDPKQRKNRACLRPEISRTKTFGRVGVSQGQFFDQYLKFIQLNKEFVNFRQLDLSYLLKNNYDRQFIHKVYSSPEVSSDAALQGNFQSDSVRVTYSSNVDFEMIARRFGLMTDFKAGVPRMAYKGIVSLARNKKRIFIAPPKDWDGYHE